MSNRRRAGIPALILLLLLVGCAGGDDRASEGPAATAGRENRRPARTTAPPTTGGRTDGGGSCDRTFTGVIARDADRGHAARELRDGDVRHAVAFPFSERAFTVYASDRPIDTEVFEDWAQGSFSTDNALAAPPGGTLVTLLVGDAGNTEPVEPGFRVDLGDGRSAPPIVDTGGGAVAETSGAAGTLEVLEIGRDGLCVRVEYEDRLSRIDGVIRAEIWQPEE